MTRSLGCVLRLAGIPVSDPDARTLVDLLLRVGRHDDLTAAATIEHALTQPLVIAPLTPDERTAVLGVLDDPPDGLAELRGALLAEHGELP